MADAATNDDLGFVPDSQTQDHSDIGFQPTPQPEPDMGPIKKVFNQNLADYISSDKFKETNPEQHEANSFLDDWMAGWQMSTTALGITRQKMPDTVLPQDATRAARIVSNAGTIAGDLPAMLGGGVLGAGIGGAAGNIPAPIVGTIPGATIGAGAGAFALPAAIRKTLMDHYQKGDIQNFDDFYDRASGTLLESLKAGGTGAATALAGPIAGTALPVAASPLLKLGAVSASELAIMITVGKAMEGKIPNKDDFIDNALLLGAFHGVNIAAKPLAAPISEVLTGKIQAKLMDTYAKTGMHPNEVYEAASQDPVLRQQLLSDDPALPQQLDPARSEGATDSTSLTIKPNPELETTAPPLSPTTKSEGPGQLKVEPLKDPFTSKVQGEGPTRTESEQTILNRIGTEEPQANKPLSWDQLYYNTIDKYDPIKVATEALADGKVLSPKDDPYAMVRTISANGRRAEAAIEAGPANFKTLEPTGTPGLKQILEPFKDDLDGFRAFAISKRAVELDKAGKETGMDIDAAKQVVKDGGDKYGEGFKQFVQFNNDILKYGRDSGIISKENFDTILEHNKNYVSFKRVMGADEGGVKGTGGGLSVSNPVKELTGSERQIIDPLESTIKNTNTIISLSEKNRAVLALTELMDKAKNPELGQKIATPKKAIDISEAEAAQALQKMGLDPEDAQAFTVFKGNKDLEDNQIASYKDGKRQVYEVPQLLANSVKQLDADDVGNVVRMLSGPAKTLRSGMIASPDFQARHFIRQELTSTVFSKDTYIPVVTTLQGLGSLLSKDSGYYEWLRAGGANDTIASLNTEAIQKQLFDLNNQTGFLDKTWNTIKSPLQSLAMITHTLDEARTLGKYNNARLIGKDIQTAVMDARDSGIDISRAGAKLRAWNMITPFENMRIQGLDLIGRKFQDDPVGTMSKLLTTITLPSVYLWYANKDDPRWQDIPRYVKDTSWVFMTNDHIYRVPKPFEPGVVFGSLPERILENFFTDNPNAFKDFQKTMLDSAMPQYIPAFAAPMIEQYANKSLMTGSPLISDHMKNVLPEYQSNPYTSDMAKLMGGVLRQVPIDLTQKPGSLGSPIILDNYVRSWGGNLGQYAIQGADKILESSGAAKGLGIDYNENPPEKTLSDMPFIKAFVVRYPSANPQAIGDFYDRFEQTQTRLNSIKLLAQQGNYEAMQKEYQVAQANGQMVNLSGYKTAMSQQLQLIQRIYRDPNTDPVQKRQQIDQFYTLILNEAHGANKILDEIEKGIPK